ncbi:MAG TPA: VTT domain-containing protein, partial [Bacteroidales bacterium]|nr:VTT domain-containing protein [Bacteroidales bacterium]
ILLQRFTPEGHFDEYLQPLYDQPMLMYLIYTLSEIFFGVIPPELFMIWALKMGSLIVYIEIVLFLALISYGAGLVGYFFGRYLSTTILFRYARRRYFDKYQRYLHKYGFFLLIVASLTPLPFSAICMLVGSAKYPFQRFLLFTLFRFVRFAAYSFVIWQSHGL